MDLGQVYEDSVGLLEFGEDESEEEVVVGSVKVAMRQIDFEDLDWEE